MEFVTGESLEQIILKRNIIRQREAISIFKQLCAALDYIHTFEGGYIYLDLKPANIFYDSGRIRLIDLDTVISIEKVNRSGGPRVLHGTKGFAAPEQYSGNYPIDIRADIYSLGVTMYCFITGKDPANILPGAFDIRKGNIFRNRKLAEIILKCTRVNPEGRYKDTKELLYELEGL